MTQEVSEEDRFSKMSKFFVDNGFEAIGLLRNEAIEKFNVTPTEFYAFLLSLLESYMKNNSTKADASKLKKIFDDEERQELVRFFDEALLKFYT